MPEEPHLPNVCASAEHGAARARAGLRAVLQDYTAGAGGDRIERPPERPDLLISQDAFPRALRPQPLQAGGGVTVDPFSEPQAR